MTTQVSAQAQAVERTWAKGLTIAMAVGGMVAISPLLWGFPSPWFVAGAVIGLLPYGIVAWKARWRPADRSAYALALGICAVMLGLGLLLLAMMLEDSRGVNWENVAYALGLLLAHVIALRFAVIEFRSRPSQKPAWRLLVRGFIDPLVYYGMFLFLAGGASLH